MEDVVRETLSDLTARFLKETELARTEYSEEYDIPSVHQPTFQEFIDWLKLPK